MPKVELTLKNKKIMFLTKKEGDYKKKVWDKEQKRVVETNELHHWILQKFSIDLGNCGREKLGFCNVEYWGEKPLVEGKYIDNMTCYLKQKKWTKKDPRTFIEKKLSEVMLVMIDFNRLVEPEDNANKYNDRRYNKQGDITPEESIKFGLEDYNKGQDDANKLVDIDEELPTFTLIEEKE